MGRSPGCSREGLNRGLWTALEDKTLTEYIKLHGEGKWRSLPQRAGLKRCGKSCRLRWLNYLRPDIKRGNISLQEEDLIIRLHKLLGNRWSLIAGRLPGRTDNEIKNYWNTCLAKKFNTSSQKIQMDNDDEKNTKTYKSRNVIQTKTMKSTKNLFTSQLNQVGPLEDALVTKKQEPMQSFTSKSAEISVSRGDDTNLMELMFNTTTEDAFLDFNNGNNDNAHELYTSSDGYLFSSKNLIDDWTGNYSFLHQYMASSSYEDFTNFVNSDGDWLF